jgi:hypothetical protein
MFNSVAIPATRATPILTLLVRKKMERGDTDRRGRGHRGYKSMEGDANQFVLSVVYLLRPTLQGHHWSHVDRQLPLSRVIQTFGIQVVIVEVESIENRG